MTFFRGSCKTRRQRKIDDFARRGVLQLAQTHDEIMLAVYVYFIIVLAVTLITMALSSLIPSKKTSEVKFEPYESGIQTETHLLQERFPMRHYLVALIFLVFDVEVIFLYPWAVIGKKIGAICFL